ncbi:hypothetical protein ES702_07790 [subsurface metagenome]
MTKKTEDLERLILEELFRSPDFTRCDVPSISPASTEISGIFETTFYLSDLHFWCGLTSRELFKIGKIREEDDIKILSILSKIAAQGKIQIHQAEIGRDMSVRDFRFKAVIGEGTRTVGHANVVYSIIRSFDKESLSDKEIEKRKCLINLSEIVAEIRKNRDKSFQAMMGTPSNVSLVSEQKEAMEAQKKAQEEEKKYRQDIATIASWIREEAEQKEVD